MSDNTALRGGFAEVAFTPEPGLSLLGQMHERRAESARDPLMASAAAGQGVAPGRPILGYGAGWAEDEYRAYGFEFPAARTRIEFATLGNDAGFIVAAAHAARCAGLSTPRHRRYVTRATN